MNLQNGPDDTPPIKPGDRFRSPSLFVTFERLLVILVGIVACYFTAIAAARPEVIPLLLPPGFVDPPPTSQPIILTLPPLPSLTPYPTQTPLPTYTALAPQILVVTATQPPASETPTPGVLLEDRFDPRPNEDWDTVLGEWRVVDGHFTTDVSGGWRRAFIGDPGWSNYAVDVDVWIPCDPVQVLVRVNDDGYLAFELNIAGTSWRLFSGGNEQILATNSNGHSRLGSVYHLRIESDQDIFTAYLDGLKVHQLQDAAFSQGRAGLAFRTHGTCDTTWFDNFVVTELP